MTAPRLHAPAQNGAILAQPELEQIGELIRRNQSALAAWRHDFQGRAAERIRAMSRAAVSLRAAEYTDEPPGGRCAATNSPSPSRDTAMGPAQATRAIERPLIATGHQPELFHPGVWIKNFASNALARRYGGASLHLVVDNDTVKRTTVRVPTGSLAQPTVVHVPLDRWRGEIPYEEYTVSDEPLFASFGARLVSALEPLGIRPLAAQFWPAAVAAARSRSRLSERIAWARRRQESSWGCENCELPVSQLCQTEGFFWFASHLLAQLRRFHAAYNQALDDYRRRHRIRSRNHPVPSLGQDGDWFEAPFWIWSDRLPRRRRLFVRTAGREMQVTDRDQWTETVPLAPDRDACCAVEWFADQAKQGIKIRTRALTTTIFSRLCLVDLFIHGLGGARYDELTDEIIRRFFGIEPPPILVLTGTLRLPLAQRSATLRQLRNLERVHRDMLYNPDRYVQTLHGAMGEIEPLLDSKRRLVAATPGSTAARRQRFFDLRRINKELAIHTEGRRAETAEEIDRAKRDLAVNAILLSRDWPFCAYPAEVLHSFVQPFLVEGDSLAK